ncbi:hypothetical protein EBZ80_02585 [bacterium]|nr:hypothetical protein [bacterium]
MTSIIIVAGIFALAGISTVILPFFRGRGGFLAAAGTIDDPARLEAMKSAIVSRIVKEESAHANGDLSQLEWSRREAYLRRRYIDVARRLDFVRRSLPGSSAVKSLLLGFLVPAALVPGAMMVPSPLAGEGTGLAATTIGDRHAIMLRGGVDQVWGHYVFTLQNDGKVAAGISTPVMLPAGAIDVRPQEGLDPEDVVVGPGGQGSDGGQVSIRKTVEPGVHLVSFGFVVPARTGHASIAFDAPYKIGELQVLTQRASGMAVSGERLVARRPAIWALEGGMEPGQRLVLDVDGVPEGRQRLWVMGFSVAALLTGLGGGLAWWSRPKRKEESLDEDTLGT